MCNAHGAKGPCVHPKRPPLACCPRMPIRDVSPGYVCHVIFSTSCEAAPKSILLQAALASSSLSLLHPHDQVPHCIEREEQLTYLPKLIMYAGVAEGCPWQWPA